jgi:hypothetical protein
MTNMSDDLQAAYEQFGKQLEALWAEHNVVPPVGVTGAAVARQLLQVAMTTNSPLQAEVGTIMVEVRARYGGSVTHPGFLAELQARLGALGTGSSGADEPADPSA